MKSILTAILSVLFATVLLMSSCQPIEAQETVLAKMEKEASAITFAKASYDFGTIKAGEKVLHDFEFTNTGSTPVVIKDVKTTCGCTVSNFPKEPIMPGQMNVISASFNSKGKSGRQNKVITVLTNTEGESYKVSLIGNVEKVQEATPTAQRTKE